MTDTPFELRSIRLGDAVIVSIVGEIDMATAPEVSSAIDTARDDAERVVVDLSEVTFLDSSALNAFVQSQQGLALHDIAFRIVSPADQAVRNVFEITRLTEGAPDADEVANKISQIAGQQILASEGNAARADQLASQEALGLEPIEEVVRRIRLVTPDDVLRVAQTYLDLDHALLVVVGPPGFQLPSA